MKGGLRQKNTEISSWQSVWIMINIPGAQIEIISYTSLSGLIFRLDIPEDTDPSLIQFYGLNDSKNDFDKPVYSLVFKFLLIGSSSSISHLDIGEGNKKIVKKTESLHDCVKEAYTQQKIYSHTIFPAGCPITVSVVDFSVFNESSSGHLLKKLLTIVSPNKENITKRCLTYLYHNSVESIKLGLTTMELIQTTDFKPLHDIQSIDRTIFSMDTEYAIAQIIILCLNLKIINYDCHGYNVLGNINPPDRVTERSVLIDFGKIIKLRNSTSISPRIILNYNSECRSRYRRDFKTDCDFILSYDIANLYSSNKKLSDDKKTEDMITIIKFIAWVDYLLNKYMYDSRFPQCKSIIKYLYPDMPLHFSSECPEWNITPDISEKCKRISKIIEMITKKTLTRGTSDKLKEMVGSMSPEKIFYIPFETLYYFPQDRVNHYYELLYLKDDYRIWVATDKTELTIVNGTLREINNKITEIKDANERQLKLKDKEEKERIQRKLQRQEDERIARIQEEERLEKERIEEEKEWWAQSLYQDDDFLGGGKYINLFPGINTFYASHDKKPRIDLKSKKSVLKRKNKKSKKTMRKRT